MTGDEKWSAVAANDASCDGAFFYAVKSTGIFCRPSCKSKPPLRDNVLFFDAATDAREAGFRPCKRCRPDLLEYRPVQEIAEKMKTAMDQCFAHRQALDSEMKNLGVTQRRAGEIFKERYGVTAREYMGAMRLCAAKEKLIQTREGIADIAFAVGFEGVSSFYRFFTAQEGMSPGAYRREYSQKEMDK